MNNNSLQPKWAVSLWAVSAGCLLFAAVIGFIEGSWGAWFSLIGFVCMAVLALYGRDPLARDRSRI